MSDTEDTIETPTLDTPEEPVVEPQDDPVVGDDGNGGQQEPPAAPPQSDALAEALKVVQQAQLNNAELTKRLTQQGAAPRKSLRDRLIDRNIKEETADIIADALAEHVTDLDERYINKQFEQVMAQTFLEARERTARESVAEQHGLQANEIKAVREAMPSIQEKYGNIPMEAAMEIAVSRIRKSAPKRPANDPMKSPAAPPHRGAPTGGKTWQDYSIDDWEKLSEEQQDNLLRRKRA